MEPNPLLIQELTLLRSSGLSARQAASTIFSSPMPRRILSFAQRPDLEGATPVHPAQIQAKDLSRALTVVFVDVLTAAELAGILRVEYPDLSALGVAQAVQAGLPTTDRADMLSALTGCGFQAADAEAAVTALYGSTVTITVQANQKPQSAGGPSSGVIVPGQGRTTITYVAGTWTANPNTGSCGPAGNPQYIAKPGYTLPNAHEGAVIGQIGAYPPFLVGASATAPAGQAGPLSLSINDDLSDRYGQGFDDNKGSMIFTIALPPSV